jgi:hypothetical protein
MDRLLRRVLGLVEEILYGGADLLVRTGRHSDRYHAEGEDPFDRPSSSDT